MTRARHIWTLMLLLWSMAMMGQMDTCFWLAAPSLSMDHRPTGEEVVLVTYDEAAEVTITQPAAGRMVMMPRTIAPHSTLRFSLQGIPNFITSLETPADGQAHKNGVLIQSTAQIMAYYSIADPNSEVYTLKGRHALGTSFVVPSQRRYACAHGAYSSIEIVATQDFTEVEIVPTAATNMGAAGDTIRLTLQCGETYAIRSAVANTPGNQHLGGTTVRANLPIAVNTTDDSAAAGAHQDLVGEQLVPTSLAGARYILPANQSLDCEYAYLYAIDDTTDIYTTDGNVETLLGTIWPGQPLELALTNSMALPIYSATNTPFVVFHLTANYGSTELAGTVMPALNCSGSWEVSYVPALNTIEAQATILTHTAFIDGFVVNGSIYELPASVFVPVEGDTTWSYASGAILRLPYGENTIRVHNTKGVFHMGLLDSGNGACSYGFFSGYGHVGMAVRLEQDIYYTGQDIQLELIGAESYSHIVWTDPQGNTFAIDESAPVLHNVNTQDAGMYIVSGEHREGCELTPDTFYLNILDTVRRQQLPICTDGGEVMLTATGDENFRWYRDGALMPKETGKTYTLTPETSTTIHTESTCRGEDLIRWKDSRDYTLQDNDSLTLWQSEYTHLSTDATYRWVIEVEAPEDNPVAPKLRLSAGQTNSPIYAVPNGRSKVYTWEWKPTEQHMRLRLIAMAPRNDRQLRILRMTLYPIYPHEEDFELNVEETVDWAMGDIATICAERRLTIPLDVAQGELRTLDVLFDEAAHRAGLSDRLQYEVEDNQVSIPLPNTMPPGQYNVRLRHEGNTCTPTLEIEATYEVMLSSDIIFQRWDDVLSLKNAEYNGGIEWTALTWYKNGEALSETRTYLYEPNGFQPGDEYNVCLTLPNGETHCTCPIEPCSKTPRTVPPAALPEADSEPEIYTLQGQRVNSNETPGLYIRQQGNHIEKIFTR